MAILKVMTKPKPKKQEVVGEMDLDKIVASPYQMAMEEKREKAETEKKTAGYRAKALEAINGFLPAKEEIQERITVGKPRIKMVEVMKKAKK